MVRYRPRIAIGAFATATEVETMIGRLLALGITRYERFSRPPGQTPSPLDPVVGRSDSALSDRPAPLAATTMLRIYLQTPAQEQVVAGALLASAAQSVQLHDIDDSPPNA
jgi:hypothetical protein